MESNTRNQLTSYSQQLPEQKSPSTKIQDEYSWIANEGVLRDEGALYGIAAADIEDKLHAIVSYYSARTASHVQRKKFLEEKISKLRTVVDSGKENLENIQPLYEQSNGNHLLPVTFQLLAILAVCFFNFFLTKYWLSPVIQSEIIIVGIYLFGLFSVHIGRGLFHINSGVNANDDQAPVRSWTIYPRELVVSAVTAAFICTLTFTSYPLRYTIAGFFILFLLFLTGKVLVNTLSRFRKEFTEYFHILKSNLRLKKQYHDLSTKVEDAEQALELSLNAIQEPEVALKQLEAEQAYKTHIFLSEYHLALQSRQALNKSHSKQFV